MAQPWTRFPLGPASIILPPALVELFASESGRISREPVEAARLLRGLAFTGTHPSFGGGEPLPSEEIVAVLLDGIRRPQEEPSC